MRDSRYDILFESVNIGPVTAKNRFYQVPHCTGLGWLRPRMVAELRGIKAEGGWGVGVHRILFRFIQLLMIFLILMHLYGIRTT